MKLEKFKKKDNKRKFIIIFTICCVFLLAGVFLYTSFAVFTEDKQFNVINGTYQDPGDIYFAVYIDGQITNTFPSKDSGYTLDTTQSSCTNGATVSWDRTNWTAIINFSSYSAGNMSRTKCTMYFEPKPQTAVEYITELAQTSDSLVYDETSDNNIRYVGSSPNNYVQFGNYTWRIIGVFNNIDDGSGNKESVLKIVSLYPVQFVNAAWDTDNVNDWTTSSLMTELNTNFYNTISSEYQQMIRTSLWNLGGVDDVDTLTPKLAYEQERSNVVYTNHSTEWVGNIGIMYISDMTYATNGTDEFDRNQCLNLTLEDWPCGNNNWNYRSETFYWTLDPLRSSERLVLLLDGGAMIFMTSPSNFQSAYAQPTLYLKSDVIITEGNGTFTTPYRISL